MVDALGVARDLLADHPGGVVVAHRAAHPADALGVEPLDVQRAGAGAGVRADRRHDGDTGLNLLGPCNAVQRHDRRGTFLDAPRKVPQHTRVRPWEHPRPHPQPRRAPRRATSADAAAIATLSPTIIPTAVGRSRRVRDRRRGRPTDRRHRPQRGWRDHISVEHLVGDNRQRRRLARPRRRRRARDGAPRASLAGLRRRPQARPQRPPAAGRRLSRQSRRAAVARRHGLAAADALLPRHWAAMALSDRVRQHLGRGVRQRRRQAAAHRHSRAARAPWRRASPSTRSACRDHRGAARRRPRSLRRDIWRGRWPPSSPSARCWSIAPCRRSRRCGPSTPATPSMNQLAVRVSADGSTLYVEGSYGLGGEDVVRRALDQNPGIRTVVLAGPGGRAIRRLRALRHVPRPQAARPASTTTAPRPARFAFLGGVERSISPGGRLGFHRGSFPGLQRQRSVREQPRPAAVPALHAKLAPPFVDRVLATPPDEVWEPTPQELLAGLGHQPRKSMT